VIARLWLLPLLLAAGIACAQEAAVLEVKVAGGPARRFGPAELAALPQAEIVEARSVGAGDRAEAAQVRWRGVLMRDILQAAGIERLDKREQRRSGVAARASDDYVVLFSWGELFNAKLGDNVLVVTAVDGKPLAASEGPYALRSLLDTRSGPRHVRWLRQLEVFTLPAGATGR
jgi:DMSO/TMAO reductase YedYZ molybdopterin-dependent catalytic subunit